MHAINCRKKKTDQLADLQVTELSPRELQTTEIVKNLQRKIERVKQHLDKHRSEMFQLLQEKRDKLEDLHHLELQLELQGYLERQQ